MTDRKSAICACGNAAKRNDGNGYVCDRCWAREHAVKSAKTRERQFESDERTVIHGLSPYLYYEVQRAASRFWAKRGISEPVERFNPQSWGAQS